MLPLIGCSFPDFWSGPLPLCHPSMLGQAENLLTREDLNITLFQQQVSLQINNPCGVEVKIDIQACQGSMFHHCNKVASSRSV